MTGVDHVIESLYWILCRTLDVDSQKLCTKIMYHNIFDNEYKFKKDFLPLLRDISTKLIPTAVNNPYTHIILESVHQVLDDILYVKNLQKYGFDALDLLSDTLFICIMGYLQYSS